MDRQPSDDVPPLEAATFDGVELHGTQLDAAADGAIVDGATFARGLCRWSESDGGVTRVFVIRGPGPGRALDDELKSRVLPGRKPTLPREA
ncbi:MAG: hypothetical protein U9N87_07345 [Planctomycetota bacterium]|nr:hypothetical protein [Planctomycetota bacterium]